MAAKYTDKFAEQALTHALEMYTGVAGRRQQLLDESSSLEAELSRLSADLAQQQKQAGEVRYEEGLSVESVTQLTRDQAARVDALNVAISEGELKLFNLRKAAVVINQEMTTAKRRVEEARATLAASYERHILESPEVRSALPLLRKAWAAWAAASDGYSAWFDHEAWAGNIVQEPTEKDLAEARKIMGVEHA